jgi:hypothetical protein
MVQRTNSNYSYLPEPAAEEEPAPQTDSQIENVELPDIAEEKQNLLNNGYLPEDELDYYKATENTTSCYSTPGVLNVMRSLSQPN